MSIEKTRSQSKELIYTLYIGMEYSNGKLEIVSEPIRACNDVEAIENAKLALGFITKKGYFIGSSSHEHALYDSNGKIIPVED